MTRKRRVTLRNDDGQIMVIVGLSMVAIVAMVGLVVDVGFAWAENRGAQNGADATAHAGAIVIVQNLAGADPPMTDADVLEAVEEAAIANNITLVEAEYTEWDGTRLNILVGAAPGNAIPGNAQGVRAVGSRVHGTFLARVIGIEQLTAVANAIAVGGPASGPCPAGAGEDCALLPVTFPTTVVSCDGQNKSMPAEDDDGKPYEWLADTFYIIPLCGNNPGSVGWIDWDPPPSASSDGTGGGHGGPGGSAELAAELCDPDPPPLVLPDWYFVTSPGNTNAKQVEDCFNQWAGDYIRLPMFDDTCKTKPADNEACSNPVGTGINQWYHFPSYAVFQMCGGEPNWCAEEGLPYTKGAYIQGNNKAVCDTGNGATSCIVGRYVNAVGGGAVGSIDDMDSTSPSSLFAVQLID